MKLLLAGAAALSLGLFSTTAAQADTVNFDEFTTPPVTCCFGSSGIVGPLNYAGVTVVDGGGSGFVMNKDGWSNMQTSGDNLFGTLSGKIFFNFTAPASNVIFDLINGTSAFDFTVTALDAAGGSLGVLSPSLTSYTSAGSVAHLTFGFGGISSIRIDGSGDFAVDTLSFNEAAVPEPASWAMMIGGFAIAGAALRRKAAKVAFA